ncbi:DNA polymeras-like protein alpha catalytic subunit [Pseudovirgaria hyperparasitica]|uniref:DNA polymerase n=1 Tax=Pseudovirgaria hyperparasitica TaxID=470096 RepID=A0A6A6WGI2_9PEZI|nr:DNA polymeras-like protein alpha catalytic subunit [Pseudovirgaria hyperparasitica]KAF2761319.1 DNA polymeras-like protein alpha catalytic subunit [Pseudovirgaria hyperparasitica]
MASRASALQKLRELRKSGKTRLESYEVAEETDLYDVVDEEGYKKVIRGRLDQDDFVVDDNGEGYADDGREDWDDPHRYGDESESEQEAPTKGKTAKRKREEDEKKKEKTNHDIGKYFNNKQAAKGPKPKPVATAEDAAFMADLLGDIDTNIPSRRAAPRPVKTETRRKTRVLSPPMSENRVKPRPTKTHNDDTHMFDTPPAENDFDMPPIENDDAPMSDQVLPSSPVVKAVERKSQAIKVEEEDDDLMEVAPALGHSGPQSAKVNIVGSRPVPKLIKKPTLPTPGSSSPVHAPPADMLDAADLNNVTSKLNIMSSPARESVHVGKLDPQHALEEDGSLRMFWLDYTEVNGSLCLFGKVKDKSTDTFVSCFIKVDNILRKLYFLPREKRQKHGRDTGEEIEMGDVYQEVDGLMSRFRVTEHKIKDSSRKYAFELPDIPKEADYLKLMYPYDKAALPTDLKGETFSHVFGTNTGLFEQFVLWKNIMGPCWLKIEDANFNAVNNASWCKLEAQVSKPKLITTLGSSDNLEAPPLTLMSISLRTKFNEKDNKPEILMVSSRVYENVSLLDTTPPEKLPCKTFTVMRPGSEAFPPGFKTDTEKHQGTIKLEKNEQSLLSIFMAILQKVDPDVLVGHRLDDFDYPVLLNRMREKKTPGWHRIGRLKRSDWPKNMGKGASSHFLEKQLAAGRLHCDLANDMGKSLMTKCQSWSLKEMCQLVLGSDNNRQEFDYEAALKTWAKDRAGLMNYLKHCETDTYFIAAVALKVQMLPLSKVLTNLAGNSWARTLSGTRAERNEYILLHEFYKNKYICPDKTWGRGKPKAEEEQAEGEEGADTKKKDKFKGGLVFEPEKGLYDKFILVMDFNSLYPSIIQEFNICFTTVERADISEEDDKVPEVPNSDEDLGILPKLIATLVKRRREVKKLMKDPSANPDQLATWDIKQMALKLTANSMYGCLGYTKSRFYARPLAMLTTFKGREILRRTKDMAEARQLRVIYGDTDSVMINTNMDNMSDALKVGNEFKRDVNDSYKLLEIDIDNVFRRLLLHAKKKYAAVNMVSIDGKYVEKLEVKGLDMRRREYCALSKDTSSQLLNFLLSGEDPETVVEKIHEYLRELSQKMRENTIPIPKYTIFTQLGKDPKDYPNGNSMPSVQVALRQIAKGKHVRAKDVMSFVITGESNGSAEGAARHAFTPEEIRADPTLKPDVDYYLHKQILPPVERLCAPISGTNITRLAECLGLDTSKYRISPVGGNSTQSEEFSIHPLESQIPDSERFKECSPIILRCRHCTSSAPFFGFVPSKSSSGTTLAMTHTGVTCANIACGKQIESYSIIAQLESQIRQHVARYYAGWLVCTDPDCSSRTRQMSVYGHRCLGPRGLGSGCLGKMQWEYTERALYNQLLYSQAVFDVDRATKGKTEGDEGEKVKILAEVNRGGFGAIKECVGKWLERNGRGWVAMDSLFGFALKSMV